MLVPGYPSHADGGCEAVAGKLGEPAGIFVGDHRGDREGNACMLGGKRRSTWLEEVSLPAINIWTLTPKAVLKYIRKHKCVGGRLG